MESKKDIISYLDNISLFLFGILLIAFPILVVSQTTEPYVLPKQALLVGISLIVLLIQGIKTAIDKTVRIRRTPFDLPIVVFTAVVFISSLLAVNRVDALTAFVPFLFAVIAYFLITGIARDKGSIRFLRSCLIGGGAILSIVSFLSDLKVYVIPLDFAKSQSFTPLGTQVDAAIYLFLVLIIALIPVVKAIRSKSFKGEDASFLVAGIIILVGLFVSAYQITSQNTILLPFETGFQVAFAAISQDAGRLAQGFLFGSGFGTFGVDFTRFKQPGFNLTPLWIYSFYKSSSFVLEMLATTGILGIVSFFYLLYKIIKEKPLHVPLVLAIIGLFLLPFGFATQALFFIILGLFAAQQGLSHSSRYFDIELQLVTLKRGLIAFETAEDAEKKSDKSKILSVLSLIVVLVFVGFVGYYSFRFLAANVSFQKSIVAAAKNDGAQTYQNEVAGLALFDNNDTYQRVFSQTNLALANNLATAVQNSGASPSAQTSQTIYTLIQQSINAGRKATSISPQSAVDWQNLSSIYRSLIGFGQNADQFAVLTAQQAVLLDPNNPQEYINLGGIYYQLGIWDSAVQQFQVAINLKPDFANAYYNLGHALEQKGDAKGALAQYQIVKNLIANDPTNIKKINDEIKALEDKTNAQAAAANVQASNEKQNLNVNTPATQLPPQSPPVKIPAPTTAVTPIPTKAVSPTPTVQQ